MAEVQTPDQVIAAIVRMLYEVGANEWSIQDKGALVAAVKLQLSERKATQTSK